MNLSTFNLSEIVSDLKEVTHYDVNFISTDGIILYSTNSKRIGNYHMIGRQACQERKTITVAENSRCLKGVKPGVNSPIIINGNVIGCIGVTGAPEVVSQYQLLTKKLTERYILAQLYVQDAAVGRKLNYKIIESITNDKSLGIYHNHLIAKGILEQELMCVAIISGLAPNIIDEILRKYQTTKLCATYDQQVILVTMKTSLKRVQNLADKYRGQLIIGGYVKAYNKLSDSYKQAVAAYVIKRLSPNTINCNSTGSLQVIASEYKYNRDYYQRLFIDKLYKACSKTEYAKFVELFIVYIESNKSISIAASELHVTESTLKYQLSKLYNLLSLDVDYTNLFLLYIACQIIKIENQL